MSTTPTLNQLGRYRVVRVLGRGAMGVVYEGHDPKLERPVAIKTILKSHLHDAPTAKEYSQRFVREAQAVARLNHPNIVTVFDFGEADEVAYLVMEFIHGRELAAAFEAREHFEPARAVAILCELLDALAYAHEHGIVHRDIKPANVMIDPSGHVKLTDFGVARLVESNADRTMPGTMVGTPSYMAPEQILGHAVGSRADLFAAGVILYQCLTQQRPFGSGSAWDVQKRILQEEPVRPSLINPALPATFDVVVQRALAKKQEDRFESAGAFADALRRALSAPAPASAPAQTPAVGRARAAMAAATAPLRAARARAAERSALGSRWISTLQGPDTRAPDSVSPETPRPAAPAPKPMSRAAVPAVAAPAVRPAPAPVAAAPSRSASAAATAPRPAAAPAVATRRSARAAWPMSAVALAVLVLAGGLLFLWPLGHPSLPPAVEVPLHPAHREAAPIDPDRVAATAATTPVGLVDARPDGHRPAPPQRVLEIDAAPAAAPPPPAAGPEASPAAPADKPPAAIGADEPGKVVVATPTPTPAPVPVKRTPPPAPRPAAAVARTEAPVPAAPAPAVPDAGAGAAADAAARASRIRAAASRCADLLQRVQLGDTLSSNEMQTLQQECRR